MKNLINLEKNRSSKIVCIAVTIILLFTSYGFIHSIINKNIAPVVAEKTQGDGGVVLNS